MLRCKRGEKARRGIAVVEAAFVLPVLLTLITGLWEMGRYVQVQQIMNNAARQGARLASQACIINTTGAYTQVYVSSGTPSVTSTVTQYLYGNGLTNLTGLTVTFTYLSGNTALTDPYQGSQNQEFVVTVTIPYSSVSWSALGLISPTNVGASCTWQIMVEVPLSVSTTLPSWTMVTNSN